MLEHIKLDLVALGACSIGFFLGLRYLIDKGFTNLTDKMERVLRGQEYLGKNIEDQSKEFILNKDTTLKVEERISNTLSEVSQSMKEIKNTLVEARLASQKEHSDQIIILEKIAGKLDK